MAKRGRSHGRAHRRELPRVRGVDDAARVVQQLVCGEHTEGRLVIGVDPDRDVCGAAFRCPCATCREEVFEEPDELVDLADAMAAEALVLATFVEPARLAPTAADVARYEGLRVECGTEGVALLDHLLFSGHRWRSVAEVSISRGISAGPDASTRW